MKTLLAILLLVSAAIAAEISIDQAGQVSIDGVASGPVIDVLANHPQHRADVQRAMWSWQAKLSSDQSKAIQDAQAAATKQADDAKATEAKRASDAIAANAKQLADVTAERDALKADLANAKTDLVAKTAELTKLQAEVDAAKQAAVTAAIGELQAEVAKLKGAQSSPVPTPAATSTQ